MLNIHKTKYYITFSYDKRIKLTINEIKIHKPNCKFKFI